VTFFDGVTDAGDRRRRLRAWWVLGGLVLLAAAAYVALHQLADDRVALGTRVAGVRLGGLTPAAAEERLHEALGPRLTRPLSLVHEDTTYPLVPDRAGVDVDWAGTVDATGAHDARWSPSALWTYFTGGRSRDPRLVVDGQRFTTALDDLTARIGRPGVEGTVVFRAGRAVPVYGRTGLVVDHDRARALVADLLVDPHPAELPVSSRRPAVSDDAVRAAVRDFARPAMSGSVTLVFGDQRVVASPGVFGAALRMVPDQGRLVPTVDADRLVAALRPVMRTLGDTPQDATVRIVADRPVVVPAVFGVTYDKSALARRLPALLVRPPGRRTLVVPAALTSPSRTTAQVRRLGITDRLGTFTVTGGTALAGGLDGTLLVPGQSMSLADQVGAPSRPLGTALFNAALRAGVVISSHTPAPTHDPAMPAGREMTDVEVTAGRHGLLVTAVVAPGSADRVTVSLWSTREWRSVVRVGPADHVVPAPRREDHSGLCTPAPGSDGFDIAVTRVRTPVGGGGPVRDVFRTHYLPVDGVMCLPPQTSPASPGSTATPG
jgi:vancomycin resistance protein YoaR